jgi:hypothetical protein
VDTRAKAVVLAQALTRSREQDNAPEATVSPPAHGVSHSFDSAEATQRLAALTGAATMAQTATQAIGAIPRPPRAGWRRRDWLLVGGATLAGLVVAGVVLRRRN